MFPVPDLDAKLDVVAGAMNHVSGAATRSLPNTMAAGLSMAALGEDLMKV